LLPLFFCICRRRLVWASCTLRYARCSSNASETYPFAPSARTRSFHPRLDCASLISWDTFDEGAMACSRGARSAGVAVDFTARACAPAPATFSWSLPTSHDAARPAAPRLADHVKRLARHATCLASSDRHNGRREITLSSSKQSIGRQSNRHNFRVSYVSNPPTLVHPRALTLVALGCYAEKRTAPARAGSFTRQARIASNPWRTSCPPQLPRQSLKTI
jgi:hypothetical protein